jgi:hypothetical protein
MPPKDTLILLLSDELIVRILSFLRATDLASCREVSFSVFNDICIQRSVGVILRDVYRFTDAQIASAGYVDNSAEGSTEPDLRPVVLYATELRLIREALQVARCQANSNPLAFVLRFVPLLNSLCIYSNLISSCLSPHSFFSNQPNPTTTFLLLYARPFRRSVPKTEEMACVASTSSSVPAGGPTPRSSTKHSLRPPSERGHRPCGSRRRAMALPGQSRTAERADIWGIGSPGSSSNSSNSNSSNNSSGGAVVVAAAAAAAAARASLG